MSGLFEPALKNWPNSDLLLNDAERQTWTAEHPRLAVVFDFENLRNEFGQHDREAIRLKGSTHNRARFAVLASIAGATLLSISGFFPSGGLQKFAAGVALLMTIISLIWIGLQFFLGGGARKAWLKQRFICERLRQFHFQYILNNWNEAASAMQDETLAAEFRLQRDKALKECLSTLKNDGLGYQSAINDVSHTELWLCHQRSDNSQADTSSTDASDILLAFSELRLGIQLRYSGKTLETDKMGPGAQASFVEWSLKFLPMLLLISTVCTFAFLLTGPDFAYILGSMISITIGALALSSGIFVKVDRAIEERDRNEAYHGQLLNISHGMRSATPDVKYALFRQLEAVSYEEMRAFLKTHQRETTLV